MIHASDIDLRPMIIDSFAGGGGASTGIEMALGRSPDVAINHSADALALHEANHPDTVHLDSNIWQVDPHEVCGSRPVGLLWSSPDCTDHSKAKGGTPSNPRSRDLATVILLWMHKVQPDIVAMENVEEWQDWGPIIHKTDEDGQPLFLKNGAAHMIRDPERKGQSYRAWCKAVRKYGYRMQLWILRGCDFGAPTIRKRLFIVARRDGRPIVRPKPTHGDPRSAAVKRGKLLPWRTAAECIDWTLPCPSIFDTKAEIKAKHGLQAVRPLADNTMARVARGMKRYVLDAERPFLVNLTHRARVEDMAEPFRTITAANRGEKALTVPSLMSLKGTDRRSSHADAPHPTVLAGGGHSTLVSPALATFYGHGGGRGVRSADLAEPLRTVTTERRHALISPVLTYAQQGGGNRSVQDPHHTICASRKDQNAMIAPVLVQTGYGERQGQAPRALDIGAPLGTAVAGGVKHAAVAAFLAQHNGGPRMAANAGHDPRDPLSTVAASGSQQMPITAFLARQFGRSIGHAVDEPAGTVTAGGGGKTSLIAPWFVKYYGTAIGARHDEPAHTVTVTDRFAHVQATVSAPPFSPEHEMRAREVAEFLRAHGAWDGGEFVTLTIDGVTYVIVDIGMRMLTPRELFNAQGFPPTYIIEGHWAEDDAGEWTWHPFTKDVQISCCGNSVCPPVAAAIIAANCGHLMDAERERVAA